MESRPESGILTVRSIATGFLIGAALTPCNIYSGLKLGFSFNMSVAAVLLSYLFWNGVATRFGTRPWGLLENNIGQTAASSAASIISAGLVAPIPALTLLTGYEWSYPVLVLWCFLVSAVGVVVALGIRKQMIVREALPFPNGIATAETLREVYSSGRDAARRIRVLLGGALLAGGLKIYQAFAGAIGMFHLPRILSLDAPERLVRAGYERITPVNLGLGADPSFLMVGFGAIVGLRVGFSMFLGGILAWVLLAPELLALGWAGPGPAGAFWYNELLEWLLWPGVALMASASITSLAISMGRLAWSKATAGRMPPSEEEPSRREDVPVRWIAVGLVVAVLVLTVAQNLLFGIPVWLGAVAVLLTYTLAVVAARVSGETGIPPIGALGKITQVSFGLLAPTSTTVNLMAANVTGGAAGQCSDLLHDLKTGRLVGARLSHQVVAQVFGIIAGSLAGSAAYLILIPDPQSMLFTEEWPAPAVATWKAVAEVMAAGIDTLPEGAGRAALLAGAIGVALSVLEAILSPAARQRLPSPASLGFGIILPFSYGLGMFLGAGLAWLVRKGFPRLPAKYVLIAGVGLVVGESLGGVLDSLWSLLAK